MMRLSRYVEMNGGMITVFCSFSLISFLGGFFGTFVLAINLEFVKVVNVYEPVNN